MERGGAVPALERGLDILELVARQGALGFGEIAGALELPPASAARLLKSLCRRGYLSKREGNRYEIGDQVMALSPASQQTARLRRAARPFMEALHAQTGQTTILFHWNGTVWECIAKILNENGMVMQEVGSIRVDIFDYPWGPFAYADLLARSLVEDSRVLLPRNKVDGGLAAEMEAGLEEYRRLGYIICAGKNLRVTAPVQDGSGRLLGALAVGAPLSADDKVRGRSWGRLVAQAAQGIQAQLQAPGASVERP